MVFEVNEMKNTNTIYQQMMQEMLFQMTMDAGRRAAEI